MKILLVGDSFAADWSVKYPEWIGWPNLLAKIFDVMNLAQAGVSEFRIYQQLLSVNLDLFDVIVLVHTSPQRIVTNRHPIHYGDILHNNADLIFSDIENHRNSWRFFDPAVSSAYGYFLYHYDETFNDWVYASLIDQINKICSNRFCITLASPLAPDYVRFLPNTIKIESSHVVINSANHLSENGNQQVFIEVLNKIESIKTT